MTDSSKTDLLDRAERRLKKIESGMADPWVDDDAFRELIAYARQLERERDALRDSLYETRRRYDEASKVIGQLQAQVAAITP